MTVYDLAERVGRLHPEFEPRVVSEHRITRTMETGHRMVIVSPYAYEIVFEFAYYDGATLQFAAQKFGCDIMVCHLMRFDALPCLRDKFARETRRKLGDRAAQEPVPLRSWNYRREVYGLEPEGISAKVDLAGGEEWKF